MLATIRRATRILFGGNNSYDSDFAIVNKSYLKDLSWSVVLYRSWCKFAAPKSRFFIVVPNSDLHQFKSAFLAEMQARRIKIMPSLLSEEWLLKTTRTYCPNYLDGWHRQRLIRLCFAKSRLARQYVAVDSSIVFTKRFDHRNFLNGRRLQTAARASSKADLYRTLREGGVKGWLDGSVTDMDRCYDRISAIMGNHSDQTNEYTSCTGLFNSDLVRELERYAIRQQIDGYAGLLKITPYDLAWYGEFVFAQNAERFSPRDPQFLTLASTEGDAERIESGTFDIDERHFGVMIQSPASRILDAETAYRSLVGA